MKDNNKAEMTADSTDINKTSSIGLEGGNDNAINKTESEDTAKAIEVSCDEMIDVSGFNRDFQGILDILGVQGNLPGMENTAITEERAQVDTEEKTHPNIDDNIEGNIPVNGAEITKEQSFTGAEDVSLPDAIGKSGFAGDKIHQEEDVEIKFESNLSNLAGAPDTGLNEYDADLPREIKKGMLPVERQEARSYKSNGAGFMTLVSAAAFLGIFLVGAFGPRPTYSESEKRALAERPELSFMGVINGNYFSEIEKWFSDTFPFKERILGMESRLEMFYGVGGEAYYGNKKDFVEDTIPETAESLAPVVELIPKEEIEETPEETVDKYHTLVETNEDGTLKVDTEPKETVEITGEQAGNIYVNNNRAYEIFYYNQGGSVKYASVINTVKAMLPECEVYDILVPNSFGVELDPSLQEELGSGNMPDAFNYIFSLMDPSVHRISVFDTMSIHKDEYIYFGTDHHWTGLGAYYAYKDFCMEKGITPHELSEYQHVDYPGFYGTFYFATNRNEALKANPDHVEAWIPMGTNDATIVDENGNEYKSKVINDVSEANAGRKYNCFLNGDNAFTMISNPNITDGSSCVVIKESYGNAFTPFLVDHYQKVYVVDYRYYKDNLRQFILDNKVQDIIFVNNVQAITERVSDEILSAFS